MVCGPRTGRQKLEELVYAVYVTERTVLGVELFEKERGIIGMSGCRHNGASGLF